MSPWDFPLTLNILDTMTTILHQIWGCSGYSNAWITTWYKQMRNIRYWVASRCLLLIDNKFFEMILLKTNPMRQKKQIIWEFFPIVGQQILIMRHICPQVVILPWRKGRWGERSTSNGRAAYPNGAPLHKSSTVDAFMCITWRNPLCAVWFIAERGRI